MLAKLWRLITAPTFDVTTTRHNRDGVVIAGQRTNICTVNIRLNADALLGSRQDEINFPRPSIKTVPEVEVNYSVERRPSREVLELDVYVHVTLAGTYSITPRFPENDYNFNLIDRKPVFFYVTPSELKFLELTSVAPLAGHGKAGSIYRGGRAEILVTGKDKFGNKTAGSDLKFDIFPDLEFIALLSTTRDFEKGTYVVSLRCDKVGITSFDLLSEASHQKVKVTDLKIIPPPVSASNSYIIQSDLDEIQKTNHEAGKPIAFKLKLYDIFRNPISCNEGTVFINKVRLVDHRGPQAGFPCGRDTIKMEENSLKLHPLDMGSNICEVEFTPFVAGNRWFSLSVDGKSVKESSIKMTVEPAPITTLQIVSQDPATFSNVYRGDTAQIWVRLKDKYGNTHAGSDVNFDILSEGSYVTLGSVTQAQNLEQGNYVLTLHWVKTGMTSFDLTASQANRQVIVKDISINVIIPPVSDTNSYIIQSDLDEMEKRVHEDGKPITFKLKLIDILGNPIHFEESADFVDKISFVSHGDSYPGCTCADKCIAEEGNSTEGEVQSLRISASGFCSDACEVTFTPFITGKRWLSFYAQGNELTKNPIKLIVIPSKERKAQVLKRPHLCQMPVLDCSFNFRQMPPMDYGVDDYLDFCEYDQKILCMGVGRRQLVGEDNGNIKNINRVLEKEYQDCKLSNDEISRKYGLLVLFDVSSFPKDAALKVFDLLSILVEGSHHYRSVAHKFGDMVKEWAEEAKEAFLDDDFREAGRCKRIKEKYASLMNESNRRASDAIFKFYNYGRPQSKIDLHGQLVGDSGKLNSYRKQLLSKGDKNVAEVDAIIERERQERDEAIRKLNERLRTFDHEEAKRIGEDWLEIIDGAGHHSAKRGEQKIRPKVQEYLRKKNLKYVEANEGALLITFSEYTGREPCVADFYCRRCKKTWTSISSWKGFFQRCFRCDRKQTTSECYPFKLRSALPERRNQTSDFTAADHRRLCQKCIQLQSDCRRQYTWVGVAGLQYT